MSEERCTITVRNLSCIYSSAGSTESLTSSRTRLYAAVVGSNYGTSSRTQLGPVLEFKNGSASGDTLFKFNINCNSLDGSQYEQMGVLDFPATGILFEDGIFYLGAANTQIMLIVEEG